MKIIYNIFENISNNTYYYYTRMLSCLKEIIPNAVQQATNQNSDNYDYSLIPEQPEQTSSEQTPSTQSEQTSSTQPEPSSTQTSSTQPEPSSTQTSTQPTVPSTQSEQSSIICSKISKKFSIYRNIETSQYKEPLLINSSEP